MKVSIDYDRQQIDVSFATSATTAVDTTITRGGLLHSVYVSAHRWAVATAGASSMSGANVVIVDSQGHSIKSLAEVLTGATSLLSADVMVFPNDIIRYQPTTNPAKVETRCTSGTGVPTSQFPIGTTVILYWY